MEKVVIDGEEIVAGSNEEVSQVGLIFHQFEGEDFETAVCNSLFGELEYSRLDGFTFEFLAQTLIECELYDNAVFKGAYFNFFFRTSKESFTYTVGVDEMIFSGNNK